MKKIILSFCIICLMANTSFAATWNGVSGTMEFKDVKRLEDVISKNRYVNAKIVKYQQIMPDEFMVKIDARDEVGNLDKSSGDYFIKFFHDIPDATPFAGKFFYWFGLFDANRDVCGYGVSLRLYSAVLGQSFAYNETAVDVKTDTEEVIIG